MFYILSEYIKYDGTLYNMKIITLKQRFNPRKDMNKKKFILSLYLLVYMSESHKVIGQDY